MDTDSPVVVQGLGSKGKKNVQGLPQLRRSQSLTPRGGGRGEKHKLTRAKQIHARKAHRPVLSYPSKVIAMIKGLENTRTKHKARLNIDRIVELTIKLQR